MTVQKKEIKRELLSFFRIPDPVILVFYIFLFAGLVFALFIDHGAGNILVLVNDYLGIAGVLVFLVLFLFKKIKGNTALVGGILIILYLFILGGIIMYVVDPVQVDANYLMSCLFTITICGILGFFVDSKLAACLGVVSFGYVLVSALLLNTGFIMTNLPLVLTVALGSSILSFYYRIKLEELAVHLIQGRLQVETSLGELQTAQKRIVTQEKLATLGALVSGISHELRNPLNFINNFSEITSDLMIVLATKMQPCLDHLPEDSRSQINNLINEINMNLKDIGSQGKRGADIIQSMLMHHRGAKSESQATDLNALVRQGADLALQGYKVRERFFNLNLIYDLDPRIGQIHVIPHEINRVILNLCSNAFYETHRRNIKESSAGYQPMVFLQTRLDTGEDGKEQVVISVRDNAFGIPPEYLDKIFLPFFTSKPTGDGTGLGLSMAYEIITSGHNGTITASNHPDGGAQFQIVLPVVR